MIEVFVPDIGDFDSVEVIEVLVSEGDTISVEDSLITVESDKATMEIPSSHAGVVAKVKVNIGDQVAEGSLVILLDAASANETVEPAKEEAVKEAAAVVKQEQAAPAKPAPAAAPAPSSARKQSPT
ncbi:MAG: hypothetical protein KAI22_07540, partial [Gammaproteobacteria bacterium]|nr:hypothetical protein [Gammaproteobacteria bacterium]